MMTSRAALVFSPVLVLLIAGCSGPSRPSANSAPATSAVSTALVTHAPAAEPGTAGAPAVPPAGLVVPIGNAPEGIVVGASGVGAVAVRNPNEVVLFDAGTGSVRQIVPTTGAARHLELVGADGPVLVPLEASNELVQLSLADGNVISTATEVGRGPHDAAAPGHRTVVVTNEQGGGVVFVRDGAVVGSLPAGPPQPGGVAAVGGFAAVADVQGNGVWVYDGPRQQLVAQAPVGVKLTHAIGLSDDLAAFADTDGGAVFIEHIDPQVSQVARIDAPGNPYGLAYDRLRHRLYVTLTASNVLRVIDISDPSKPRTLGGLPTVQQPNSVAVDPRSGAVLITGSTPGRASRLQIIAPDLLPTA
jgi:DNA-binding beta-propeller fold protein YncE